MSTKENVLQALREAEDFLSGEKLAQQLDISRTAIWKGVKELEKDGYKIESGGKGYRLLPSDVLDAAAIKAELKGDAQTLTIKTYPSSESTMKDAKIAAINEEKTPLLLIADMQEAPHGRFKRPFFAKEKAGIYMSLLLNPEKPFAELPQYTVLMAVAVAEAIDALTPRKTAIKWVNDIYIEGKKVAGILSEAVSDVESGSISSVIIGMGINFSILQTEFPQDIQKKVTSLFPDSEPTISRNRLIAEIWNRFFLLLKQSDMDYLDTYRQKSFVLGKIVTFQRRGQTYSGKAIAINDLGELIVDLGSEQLALSSGEISLESII